MLLTENLKIYMSRGDTGSITINFTGDDVPPDGTGVLFALQKTLDSDEILWEKRLTVTSGSVTIPLLSEDTDYPRGRYYWCLRLLYANGDIYTPIEKPQEFNILAVIGNVTDGDNDGE